MTQFEVKQICASRFARHTKSHDHGAMQLGEAIRELRKKRGLTQGELADGIEGYDAGNLSRFERGMQGIELDKLGQLAKKLGVTVADLYVATERGIAAIECKTVSFSVAEPQDTSASYAAAKNVERLSAACQMVPVISWVQAGHWAEAVDSFAPGAADDYLPCPSRASRNTFALRVRGISMEPEYQDGDIIFVDPEVPYAHGKHVVVRLNDEDEAVFKQLIIEGDKRFLKALNPEWPGPRLTPINGNATICGVVIGKWVSK